MDKELTDYMSGNWDIDITKLREVLKKCAIRQGDSSKQTFIDSIIDALKQFIIEDKDIQERYSNLRDIFSNIGQAGSWNYGIGSLHK